MRISVLVVCLAAGLEAAPQRVPTTPIFHFATDGFWLNLHHFLYVLGRAEEKSPDAARDAVADAPGEAASARERLSARERIDWAAAVAAYASGLSRKDLVFDAPLPEVTGALARAGDRPSLAGSGIDPVAAATLESVADVYRRVWWPAHRAANRRWVAALQPLLERHGERVLAYITRAYALPWPAAGYPVNVSAYANWAGAYSTAGNLLVISSRSRGNEGLNGLELVFHEAMHQWDDPVFDALAGHARRLGVRIPRGVTHAMVFYTAGEAVRSVVPGHVPYAETAGIWNRGMAPFRGPLVDVWQPWLDGRGTRESALAALAARVALSR